MSHLLYGDVTDRLPYMAMPTVIIRRLFAVVKDTGGGNDAFSRDCGPTGASAPTTPARRQISNTPCRGTPHAKPPAVYGNGVPTLVGADDSVRAGGLRRR